MFCAPPPRAAVGRRHKEQVLPFAVPTGLVYVHFHVSRHFFLVSRALVDLGPSAPAISASCVLHFFLSFSFVCQEQELRELLVNASRPTATATLSEGADGTKLWSPLKEPVQDDDEPMPPACGVLNGRSSTLGKRGKGDGSRGVGGTTDGANGDAMISVQVEEAVSADPSLSDRPLAGVGARRGGGHTAATPDEHPVLELFRSIGEPLDQLSFEELKRKVASAVEQVCGRVS